MAMARLALQTLIDRLERLGPPDITVPGVQELLADGTLVEAELTPFVGARPEGYARRAVYRSRWFDVMVLSWAPGQATPIHNHAGNCGWVRLVRGVIAEETFRLQPGSAVPDAATAGSVQGKRGQVGLEPTGQSVIATPGAVATVDRVRAIHRLGNPADSAELAVSLHVYSLPHDTCLAFDLRSRTCERRELRFDPLLAGSG